MRVMLGLLSMADVPQEVLEELNDALEKEAQQYSRMLEDHVKAFELVEQTNAKEFHQYGDEKQAYKK